MIAIEAIAQLITLGTNLITGIIARRQARQQLDQGQKLRAVLEQSNANTKIYDEIVAEAQKQINERNAQIKGDVAQFEKLFGQLKAAANE